MIYKVSSGLLRILVSIFLDEDDKYPHQVLKANVIYTSLTRTDTFQVVARTLALLQNS